MTASFSISQLHPMPGYVLIEPAPTPKQTASGIYLPDNYEEKQSYGKVIAVGDVVTEVKKGDQVIFKLSFEDDAKGTELKVNDIEYLFLKSSDILAVIK